ncbi:WAP four-disulfide core domain protein 18 isoform X1 [Mus pahari]|uniref:WAP four-disulfide core domain protein 18 isoform X1 n=1 Tax=Mus pahari TaxID=10093 RepID=UPI000A3069E1|nr:WAP four-disulfide core domain protein 18 isoform X1 [Mus pahari]
MKTATVFALVALIFMTMNTSWALSNSKTLEKPGACPKLPPHNVGTCDERCTGDGSCSGNMKCCSNGCGHVCKPPVF